MPNASPCTGIECGSASNGCGGTVACDSCPNNQVCDRRCDKCLGPLQVCP
jgi:hypothetical protein